MPVPHDGDPIGELQRFQEVVGDEDDGLPQRGLQPQEFILHLAPDQRIERAERLVEKPQGWFYGKASCDADTLLHQPDLRASERTFQLIAQVAGRTGRGDKGGRVLVQSSCPDEPAIRFAAGHDYDGFAQYELAQRRELSYPPYSHLARVILRGENYERVHESAREMAKVARTAAARISPQLRILGPAPAPITKLRGEYRFHFQVAADEVAPISQLWHDALAGFEVHAGVEFTIDVDPLDMR